MLMQLELLLELLLLLLLPLMYVSIHVLGALVGTQRKKTEHVMFASHFERRTGSTKRLHNASTKTRGEDRATPF